jgi:hypothetical protein
MSANQAGVVTVSVKLAVNNTTPDIERQVRLYGPGDVTGIDQLQVIRTEPRHLATDFEPNYFPAVEFDRPDFPWLFTPAKANADGKLRPWLCLVVIRKQQGMTLRVDRNLPLPVLEIKNPETELPDLSESWAWAHAAPLLGDFTIGAEGQVRSLLDFKRAADNSSDAKAFRSAARDHQAYMARVFMTPTPGVFQPLKLSDTRKALLDSLNPRITIQTRVQASLLLASDVVETDDPLEPVMDAPECPQPMYEALRDLSQDFLLPGLEHVPQNTVTLLGTNPNFVESFLVGLNAEMSHELLWRDYPTDQRGTYFRQFWDTSVNNAEPDIEAISKWNDHELGQNSPNTSGKLVLLIRGELLRRYPNSVIYAVAAVKKGSQLTLSTKPEDERHPLFRGSLKPDVTFLGFDLTEGQAKGDEPPHDPDGWFFVIQQHPTEPCFGMDVADFAKEAPAITTTWNELSWRHMAKTEEELQALSHVSIDTIKSVMPNIETQTIDNATWGKNSSHLAYITLQRPLRIAIHAREMIKKV